jgi:hypothetical protein
MLTRLEESYARTDWPVIAIALTTRDMFNPSEQSGASREGRAERRELVGVQGSPTIQYVNWTYVFSYRRNNRLAVVSPARMEHGCMGVFAADEQRIMARLRKMVGKNIGIMYFGLGMSQDPVSMLYANIGGPQELDAMSELF